MYAASIIISTYNWPEALNLCLLSIRNQTVLPAEVIIADDGSGHETKALVERLQLDFPVPLIHIWHEDNGFRKSLILNKSIKRSSGDYIIQIDGDVITDKHFIEDHLNTAERGFFVRGTRAHIKESRLPEIFSKERTDLSFLSAGIINRFNAIRLPLFAFLAERKRDTSDRVRGSNFAYWKSDFILVNGYNNDLQGWGHEDEELAARFINNMILKKVIKLTAIQFHLSHRQAARDNESRHGDAVRTTLKKKLKVCINGYAQS
ncbi:MAG TPA: glycosyltransferase family 2 protein [Pedobacter sp.]